MAKGWTKEYVDEGGNEDRSEGMLFEAREMILEALYTKFSSNVPADVYKLIQALNDRMLLKKNS